MDPNATLKRIQELVDKTDRVERGELHEACHNLNSWLGNGGFAPKWVDYPEAFEFFRSWQAVNA